MADLALVIEIEEFGENPFVADRADGERRHELFGGLGHDRAHAKPALTQAPDQIEALIGRDPAADDQQYPSFALHRADRHSHPERTSFSIVRVAHFAPRTVKATGADPMHWFDHYGAAMPQARFSRKEPISGPKHPKQCWRSRMRAVRWVVAAVAVVASATMASSHEATSKGVTVAHPWARATPGGATVGAAFMEIRTDKGVTDRLISVASPVAGRAEVHTHIMDGNVMKMRRVEALDLKDGTSHVLKPMGDHIMLFDLKQPLKEGDLIKIALTFEKAGVVEVEGTVEPVGAMGPHGMDHQPMLDDTPSKGDTPDGKSGHEHMGHH